MERTDDNMVLGPNTQTEVLEMQHPVSNTEELDSLKFGDATGILDMHFELASDDQTIHSALGSRTSTPTSGTEYKSCSNPSSPERHRKFDGIGSTTPQNETACSINMSANIASKLKKMRRSEECLDSSLQNSFEELDAGETLHVQPSQDTDARGSPPATGKKRDSQKPSLRQVFPYISCLPFENNIIFCFVLSVWDNIVGPQTVYVWKRKAFPSQKTFDDLFEETGGVHVRKGRKESGSLTSEQTGAKLETHASLPSKDETGQNKKNMPKNTSRKSSNASSHSENNCSIELEEISSYNEIKNTLGCSVQEFACEEEQNLSCTESFGKVSNEEMLLRSGNVSNNNESFASQEMSHNYADLNDEAFQDSLNPVQHASATRTSSDSFGEADEQEFGSSWSCGRSRLRIGKVVWYVTVHSVGVGQVGPSLEKITSSLHVVPHQGIIIMAARFTVEEEDGAVPYCLSMVVPLEEYKNFLPLKEMVTTWLVTIAATTRLLITKHGLEGGGRIKGKLVELCDVLVALRSASLDQYPLTPAGRPPDDRRLAEIILTSHLQTMGSTVVVADSPNAANKMVMWIAQFSDPSTLPASRLCLSYTQWPFHPGLYIQGIVRSSSGEVNLSAQKLIQSSRPLTVVDVNRGTVKQTGAPDVHARRNSSALHQELLSLWHDLPDVSAPSESLLEPVRVVAPIVKRFLHDYDRLSSCKNEVRQNFIQAFLRSLQYTALALITWTRHEWSAQRRKSGYGSLRRSLCTVFDLDEVDLRVVLAQAEILEPGFYSYVTSMSQ
nr:uncharacterized protein LOC128687892 [Cherax quadricarinatus]XP_053631441.1 uncharacterized protein LOC128687892 [Cherax quadricarinatus]XP_053631442.1 uncharacterized protein LOC128687892 [Cherax quadricarinatus]XP_053631443.1 uncharacterized protein LOC128687892 [Cherax quadricarinatus]